MKSLIFVGLALMAGVSFSHDEGHGPKATSAAKRGGKVGAVIAASDASKGPKATLIYKAELVRTEDDQMKLYFYDKEMNALPDAQLSRFEKSATATVEHLKKGKSTKTSNFNLALINGVFEGKIGEKPKTQTFNVAVKIKEDDKELLAVFDGLETRVQ